MQSRLLSTLDREARTTNDPEAWARVMCRLAAQHGRQGHTDQAQAVLQAVRDRFEQQLTPRVAAWMMLAEGILLSFQGMEMLALDRIRRAHAVSVAAKLPDVHPTCAGWMGMVLFNQRQYGPAVGYMVEAVTHARPDDHQCWMRVSLLLAHAFDFSGDSPRARAWYDKTRHHATAEGDEVTLSALMYSIAANHVDRLRMADVTGLIDPQEAHRAMLEANSTKHFDAAIGTASLTMLVPLLRGQLLTVEQKYAEAAQVLGAIDRSALQPRMVPPLLADLVQCLDHLGQHEQADTHAGEVYNQLLAQTMDADDLAHVHTRLSQWMQRRRRATDAAKHQAAALAAHAHHRMVQHGLATQLGAVRTQLTKALRGKRTSAKAAAKKTAR